MLKNFLKYPIIILLSICLIMPSYTAAFAANMKTSDINNHWAKDTLTKAVSNGWIQGYQDGSIRPDSPVTRSEFVAFMNRILKIELIHGNSSFSDVESTDWFYNDICSAKAAGYISGDPGGAFRPGDPISRQEACSILARYLNILETYDNAYIKEFNDYSQIASWAQPAVAVAREFAIISGLPDGSFAPAKAISRAESIIILSKADQLTSQVTGIAGKVCYKGSPVKNALISLRDAASHKEVKSIQSDDQGMFKCDLEAGIYDISASQTGKSALKAGVKVKTGRNAIVKLVLMDGANVIGKLVNQDGSPIANAELYFKADTVFAARTDADGKFNVILPKNSKYSVSFKHNGATEELTEISIGDKEEINLGEIKAKPPQPAYSGGRSRKPSPPPIGEDNDEYALAALNGGQMPKIFYSDETGIPKFIDGRYSSKKIHSAQDAINSLYSVRTLMKIENPVEEFILDQDLDLDGMATYRLQQVYEGIPVHGRQFLVNVDGEKTASSLNGNYFPGLRSMVISTIPQITNEQAVSAALQDTGLTNNSEITQESELIFYTLNENEPKLTWLIYLSGLNSEGEAVAWRIVLDASNGSIIAKEDLINPISTPVYGNGVGVDQNTKFFTVELVTNIITGNMHYEMRNPDYKIQTYNTQTNQIFKSNDNTWTDAAAVDAHYNAEKVFRYYKDKLGRKSYDGKGATVTLKVHARFNQNHPFCNACWNGTEILVGDGCGRDFGVISAALDVIAHEFTHAVINKSANLRYHNQSGALNEAYCDIMGNIIEGKNDPAWLIGEDCYTPQQTGDALRSMSSPGDYGQPAHFTRYVQRPDDRNNDWGGVHTNSGIINKAFYNMWKDTFGSNNSNNLLLAKIWYKSLVSYLVSTSNFEDCAIAVTKSARDYGCNEMQLIGITTAFYDVGIGHFKDLDSSAWYYPYFKKAVEFGIVQGYSDGTVKPTKVMTNAEYLKILCEAAGLHSDLPSGANVPDIWKGHWAAKYLELAINRSWISAEYANIYPTWPDDSISRQVAGSLLWTVFKGPNSFNKNTSKMKLTSVTVPDPINTGFTDQSSIYSPYLADIYQLSHKKNRILTGYENSDKKTRRLEPNQLVDRATCCTMVMRCFKWID